MPGLIADYSRDPARVEVRSVEGDHGLGDLPGRLEQMAGKALEAGRTFSGRVAGRSDSGLVVIFQEDEI